MLNIDYAPGARKSRLAMPPNLIDRYGRDLGKHKFLEIQLAMRSLRLSPEKGDVVYQDSYGLDIRRISVNNYVISYQIFETHIYIMDIEEKD